MASILLAVSIISWLALVVNSIPQDAKTLLEIKQNFAHFPISDWSDASNFCNWTGVTCDPSNQSVVALNLQGKAISGSLPTNIPLLRSLATLNLSSNSIGGPIPPSAFAPCSTLSAISLDHNNLTGSLPHSLSNCTALRILDLSFNNLVGTIPPTLSMLSNLQQLNFRQNNLRGPIPKSISNCTNLVLLDFCLNFMITGTIPSELGLLTRLENLCLDNNDLSGSIPAAIVSNLTQLRELRIGYSRVGGRIPALLGRMPYLEKLWLESSLYEGSIPPELGNISSLQILAIYNNSLTGRIPGSLGQLSRLTGLSVSYNYLTGSLPLELSNLTNLQIMRIRFNSLSGSVPAEYGRLKSVQQFQASNNNFSGGIPADLGNCSSLALLDIRQNQLTGPISSELGRLSLLNALRLEHNQLTGPIPESLSNCTSLQDLTLGYNMLQGNIPRSIASLRYIAFSFSMPRNLLTGEIPTEIGGMISATAIDLAGNLLNGKIPQSLGSCVQLEALNLSNNHFCGEIPQSLGSLISLEHLDISSNKLTGPIPDYLGRMSTLQSLNVSYNRLSGPIPQDGVFRNLSATSFIENSELCGPNVGKKCPQSAAPSSGGLSNVSKFGIIVGAFAFAAVVLTAVVYIYTYRQKKKKSQEQQPQQDLFIEKEIQVINPRDLIKATAGFNDRNIIGSGRMAMVYRGILDNGKEIAVKRFKEDLYDSIVLNDSLIAEIQILATIRHRNLVGLVGYCFTSKTKALIMDMMPNRNLAWHIEEETLDWEMCVRIAFGVAQGLRYLHHECLQPILHCDLKPSNILLDVDFEPAIGDFGLSRVLNYEDPSYGFSTSNIKGSIGYMPPEYAFHGRVTEKGDVYSFGIVILEMISGKNPTSDMFSDENSLRNWALKAATDGMPFQIVAAHLVVQAESSEESVRQMLNMVHLGLACSSPIPENRPNMKEVVRIIEKIMHKSTAISVPSVSMVID